MACVVMESSPGAGAVAQEDVGVAVPSGGSDEAKFPATPTAPSSSTTPYAGTDEEEQKEAEEEERKVEKAEKVLDDSTRLGKIRGLDFPSYVASDLFQPAVVFWALFIELGRALFLLLPGLDDAPPPFSMTKRGGAEHRYGIGTVPSVYPIVFFISVLANISPRLFTVGMLMSTVLCSCAFWFMGTGAPGTILTIMIWTVVSARFSRRAKFTLALWSFCTFVLAVNFYILKLFPVVQAVVQKQNSAVAGILAPLTATICSTLGCAGGMWILRRFGCPGLNRYVGHLIVGTCTIPGDILRLVDMVNSGGDVVKLATLVASSLISDMLARTCLFSRISPHLRKQPFRVRPAQDLYLRSRFGMPYMAIMSVTALNAFVAVAGVAWALEPSTWIGTLVFLLSAIMSDFLIAFAHRLLYPVPGEGILATTARLSAEPRAHWPAHQSSEPAAENVWAPSDGFTSRISKRLPADDRFGPFLFVTISGMFGFACTVGFFGLCGLGAADTEDSC
jgi:hypothetical protein